MSSVCPSGLSDLLRRPVELQKFKAKYEKYYARACDSTYIHMLSALFHHDAVKVFKISQKHCVDVYSELTNIAFKIMNFEIIENGDESSETEDNGSTDERYDFMKMKEVKGIFADDGRSNMALTVKDFKRVLREHLLKEIKGFRQFWESVCEVTVMRLAHEMKVKI
ncbi:uncharacterized protein KNAG_0H01460 [Huiozyma naganishii CBS 8797]|uniref:Uncharacterized protein n=1 Tax=Huiozyma naganishii (strain ATCC MYA-139 / BCRC 22969 / CBS 8797 / KCTC 17520 / NBRC 10181 / NCYC 3082 / Yp74L-3) TaxID=1071383 RepID=J7R9M5_HUIN7|nr:hypothetical protein KNAG_0H01460 [Kazachstania naganishii CBS 8797]CCK71560.1 hypothetical protein KNAG_0H01460 [Kazachstania naganishii CBS 8797]